MGDLVGRARASLEDGGKGNCFRASRSANTAWISSPTAGPSIINRRSSSAAPPAPPPGSRPAYLASTTTNWWFESALSRWVNKFTTSNVAMVIESTRWFLNTDSQP